MSTFDDVSRAERMDRYELKAWMAQFLRTGNSSPLHLRDAERSPVEMIMLFVKDIIPTQYAALTERVKDAIGMLCGGISPHDERDFDFCWDIITLASRIKAFGAKDILLPLMNRGEFRGKIGRGEDLHYCILDALATLGLNEQEIDALVDRDLNDLRYVEPDVRDVVD